MININENEMATKLLKKIICETIINILNENNTSKYYFIVEKMLNKPININMNRLTHHFNNDRKNRFKSFNEKTNDIGNPVYSFVVNCGHSNGKEIHTITEKAVILIHNVETKKLVTMLFARPGQIIRYWKTLNIELPRNDSTFNLIIRYSKLNKDLGHNKF